MIGIFALLLMISTIINALQDGINFHKKPKGAALRDLWHILKQADRVLIMFIGYFGISAFIPLPILAKIVFCITLALYVFMLKYIWKIIYTKFGQKVSELDTSWRFSLGAFLDKLLGFDK